MMIVKIAMEQVGKTARNATVQEKNFMFLVESGSNADVVKVQKRRVARLATAQVNLNPCCKLSTLVYAGARVYEIIVA